MSWPRPLAQNDQHTLAQHSGDRTPKQPLAQDAQLQTLYCYSSVFQQCPHKQPAGMTLLQLHLLSPDITSPAFRKSPVSGALASKGRCVTCIKRADRATVNTVYSEATRCAVPTTDSIRAGGLPCAYTHERGVHAIAPCDSSIRQKVPNTQHECCAIGFPVKANAAIFADTPCVQTLVQGLNTRGIRLRLRGMFVASTKV